MQVLNLAECQLEEIHRYASSGVSSVELASADGAGHVYLLVFEPDGDIGEHPTGFRQLLVPLSGHGWVSGGEGSRQSLQPGQVALFEKGETHAKGGGSVGMTAMMVQLGG